MNDPFGNMQNLMGQFQRFIGNPMGFMMQQKLNIHQEYLNDPNAAIQYLMNNGQMNQQQYNQLQQMAKQIEKDPTFIQRFGGLFRR